MFLGLNMISNDDTSTSSVRHFHPFDISSCAAMWMRMGLNILPFDDSNPSRKWWRKPSVWLIMCTVPFNSIWQGVWPVTSLTKLWIWQVKLWPVTHKNFQQKFISKEQIFWDFFFISLDGFVRGACDLGHVWHFDKPGGPVTCDLLNWIKWYSTGIDGRAWVEEEDEELVSGKIPALCQQFQFHESLFKNV